MPCYGHDLKCLITEVTVSDTQLASARFGGFCDLPFTCEPFTLDTPHFTNSCRGHVGLFQWRSHSLQPKQFIVCSLRHACYA
jgi:hypothetical protein